MRRRAVVAAVDAAGIDVRWTESRCRGCVGCGGRCSLFAAGDDAIERLPATGSACRPGMAVEVEVSAPRLRRAAGAAYGLALLALLVGVVVGHAVGGWWGQGDAGAFLGLLLGTFSAGRLTKRLDAAPPVRVRPSNEPDPQEPPC